MLKKTGIVAAAIAASLLAVTPLAFAGGTDSDKKSDSKDSDDDNSKADDDDSTTTMTTTTTDDDDDDDDADDDDDDDDDDRTTTTPLRPSTRTTTPRTARSPRPPAPPTAPRPAGTPACSASINLAANVVAPITAQAPLLNCNNLELEDTVDVLTINPSTRPAAIERLTRRIHTGCGEVRRMVQERPSTEPNSPVTKEPGPFGPGFFASLRSIAAGHRRSTR